MTKNKRFELKVNKNNQYDIIDLVESKEKNALCIYNDLGNYYFSSAKALCELLNELNDECDAIIEVNNEIDRLKRANKKLNISCIKYSCERDSLEKDVNLLEEENEQLKFELNKLSRENRRFEIFIQRLHDIAEENGALSKCRVKAEIQYFREQC